MWFELKNDLFSISNLENLRKLINDLCYKHKYNFFVDISTIADQEIFDKIYPENTQIIIDYYDLYITKSPKDIITISNIEGDFNMDQAIIFIEEKFELILENDKYDGYFVDCLLREFNNKSKKIKRFKENNWFRYHNAGGADNIINTLEQKIGHFGSNKFLKCFVLVDSDLEYPSKENQKRRRLSEFCHENRIPFHILEKREMENYMPISIFESINSTNFFIRTYLDKLNCMQKDFIDIQNGFDRNKAKLKEEKIDVFNLFSNLLDEDFKKLETGIGSEFENYKRDYPKLFDKATQEGLIKRTKKQDDPDELRNLLIKIDELL